MPEWCPRCHAMLAPGVEVCPACGARQRPSGAKTAQAQGERQQIFWFSMYILGIALAPILVGLAIGAICLLTGNR